MSKTQTTGQAGRPAKNQTTPINETSVAKMESKKNDQPKKPRSQSGKSQTKPKKEDDKNVPAPKQTADKPDSKPNTAPKASNKGKNSASDPKGHKKTENKKPSAPEGAKPENTKNNEKKVPNVPALKLFSNYALMKYMECHDVALIDAPLVSTEPKKYVSRNTGMYYVAINSWLLQVSDVLQDVRTVQMLRDQVVAHGLLHVIRECQYVADQIIAGYGGLKELSEFRRRDIEQIFQRVAHKVDDQQLLQLLRYLKRFSPSGTDLLANEALSSFYSINEKCGVWQRDLQTDWSGIPDSVHKPIFQHASSTSSKCDYLEDRLSWYLKDMMQNFEFFLNDPENGPRFSDGSSQDGKLKSQKLMGYAARTGYWLSPEYPIMVDKFASVQFDVVARKPLKKAKYYKPLISRKDGTVIKKERLEITRLSRAHSGIYETRERYSVTPEPVPKSYKTARIIASEDAYHGAQLQCVKSAMESALASTKYIQFFDPTIQDRNRNACQMGSSLGTYATIDLSGASDSISKSLAYRILPAEVTRAVDAYLARYLKLKKGGLVLSKIFATSGCPITFITLGCICLAICLVAADIYFGLTGEVVLVSYIFGDDCCVDVRIYQLVCDIFSRLGFTINATKSYSTGSSYRESCGAEYTCGYDLTTKYFTRKQLNFSKKESQVEALSRLIDLQHKLFDISWTTQRFLADICDCVAGSVSLTRSLPGSRTTDIWSEILDPVYRPEPYDQSRGGVPSSLIPMIAAYNDSCEPEDVILCRETKDGKQLEILALYSSAFKVKTVKEVIKEDDIAALAAARTLSNNMDMYYYASWLKYGPRYDEPLLELLGIPSKLRKELDRNICVTELTYTKI